MRGERRDALNAQEYFLRSQFSTTCVYIPAQRREFQETPPLAGSCWEGESVSFDSVTPGMLFVLQWMIPSKCVSAVQIGLTAF